MAVRVAVRAVLRKRGDEDLASAHTDVSTERVVDVRVVRVDFVSLLLLGLDQTLIIAAAGAFSQSAWKNNERRPLHRTLFSVATLVITVTGAGLAFILLSVPGPTR